jgi:hypothetical protein
MVSDRTRIVSAHGTRSRTGAVNWLVLLASSAIVTRPAVGRMVAATGDPIGASVGMVLMISTLVVVVMPRGCVRP